MWSGGTGLSTCVGSLSGGSETSFRELWAFGGCDAREGSGIGGRFGRGPGLSAENGAAGGFTFGVLSRSARGEARGTAGGLVTAGVSSVGANRSICVRESGAGGIAWTSVRVIGGGVGIDRGNGRGRCAAGGDTDAAGFCAGQDG